MTEYVRVPREPTPEMLKAGASTLDDFWKAQERGPTHVQEAWPGIVQIYAAMLAASPQGEDRWIKHDGGPNPVPGKLVDLISRQITGAVRAFLTPTTGNAGAARASTSSLTASPKE